MIIKTTSLLFLITLFSYSQNLNTEKYQYISPEPGSGNINPENNIIIRQGSLVEPSTIDINLFIVSGSESGNHKGKVILSDDLKTFVFLPQYPFNMGEEVSVKFNGNYGDEIIPLEFSFSIKSLKVSEEDLMEISRLLDMEETDWQGKAEDVTSISEHNKYFKASYPEMILNISNNPSPGYIFLTLLYPGQDSYLMIMDNGGIPIFYKRLPWASRNLLLQPDGLLTYFDHSAAKFFQMDSSYAIVDSFYCRNGFESTTGFHDFIHLENGHSLLLARDNRVVRMDTIVVGGDSAAIVSGFVIQELDANENVIFQWNTFDHFQITDATEDINLLAHTINPYHCNSLAIDNDGNLLLSSRHLEEITKIDRQTGQIIWRFGGVKSANNEFVVINDMRTFSHQHSVRRLANGNLTLLDNGNLHIPPYSRGLEYEMDEINKTATLVWNFSNNPVSFTGAAGSVQRLFDNNTIIGWGVPEGNSPGITEIDFNGNIKLDFSYPENYTSYRALKYPWKTNLFLTDPDSIFFESIAVGDSASIEIYLKSNSSEPIEINDFYNRNSQFSVDHPIPFKIQPFQAEIIQVKFKPTSDGYFTDTLHIRSETDTSRIAQIVVIGGRTDSIFSSVTDKLSSIDFRLEQNYPNPFNPTTNIGFRIADRGFVSLIVYDVLGNEIVTLVNEELPEGEYEVEFSPESSIKHPASGIYFYQLKAGNFIQSKKMILLK